ncbi:MAG TPA: ribosome-associated translation inhibitor RaiA [Flavobacteriales bacterium]|nr:ribosome-associated translation inhibitor RaiA [Flavobacteriales bacterium]
MNVQFQSVHFSADKKLVSFAQEKVTKLNTMHDKIISSEVILRLENSDAKDNKVAEIKLNIPGKELFAKRQCTTFEEAVDLSVDALKNQIAKYKGKLAR